MEASMDKLRPLVTKWYANHAEAIQLLSSGEIDICCTIGPRGLVAKKEGAPIDVEFDGRQACARQLGDRQGVAQQSRRSTSS